MSICSKRLVTGILISLVFSIATDSEAFQADSIAGNYSQTGHLHKGNEADGGHNRSRYHNHSQTHLKVDYNFDKNSSDYQPPEPDEDGYFWWKGNLHTHTLWSDGDQFPEVVARWYYEQGYHFLAMSDHNIMMRGEKWINPATNRFMQRAGEDGVYEVYRELFGDEWVETRNTNGDLEIRLKPLNEVRPLFEEAGRFLMIESEEITEQEHVIHVNATNNLEFIKPQTGRDVEETIRLNINAVLNQRSQTGQVMLPHLNHPNFRHAVSAEDMIPIENLKLFEIYNGHRGVLNFGDEEGAKDLDRLWDIVLTRRLGELELGIVYGVAVDDAHHYESSGMEVARPGRGWVHVRSPFLTPEYIVKALENGDFYSSTGVSVKDIRTGDSEYEVQIEPEDEVKYTIQFIGTREEYDTSSEPYVDADGNTRNDRTRNYSEDIGRVLKETTGNKAIYEFEGDELYVRVKIISSKLKENYFYEGEHEKAWLQPVRPGLK